MTLSGCSCFVHGATNFVTKKEYWCVLSENVVLFVKCFFQYNNMFSFNTLSSTTQPKLNMKVHDEILTLFPSKVLVFDFLEEDRN